MPSFDQQLDLDGGRHDLSPEHETQRLFDSAPQIRGQIALDTDTNPALAALRYHVTGAIERGEAEPITEVRAPSRGKTLDRVRALFPVGALVECVENTYRPELNGQRRRVVTARKSSLDAEILDGPGAGKPFRMALPERAGDVLELGDDHVTFRLGQPARGKGDHTASYRVRP